MTVASACTQDCRRRVRERACRGPVGPVEFAGVGWEEGSPHFSLATLPSGTETSLNIRRRRHKRAHCQILCYETQRRRADTNLWLSCLRALQNDCEEPK